MVSPISQYEQNRDTYETIADNLDSIRETFVSSDRKTQKTMLYDSSVFAVVSVQNDISVLRRAFRAYCNADTWNEVQDAMRSVNYGNNKYDYMQHNFSVIMSPVGTKIITQLENGNSWKAVMTMVSELKGVSYVKAPFVACMLGFTDLMCIDTNVAQMIDDDSVQATAYRSIEEYREAISKIEDKFDNLADEVSTFMLQWIVFDANREDGVARHEEWFEHMLPGSPFGRQQVLDSF